ncbi:hypothetical protein KIPB_005948, partial [Kipferlia bialata]
WYSVFGRNVTSLLNLLPGFPRWSKVTRFINDLPAMFMTDGGHSDNVAMWNMLVERQFPFILADANNRYEQGCNASYGITKSVERLGYEMACMNPSHIANLRLDSDMLIGQSLPPKIVPPLVPRDDGRSSRVRDAPGLSLTCDTLPVDADTECALSPDTHPHHTHTHRGIQRALDPDFEDNVYVAQLKIIANDCNIILPYRMWDKAYRVAGEFLAKEGASTHSTPAVYPSITLPSGDRASPVFFSSPWCHLIRLTRASRGLVLMVGTGQTDMNRRVLEFRGVDMPVRWANPLVDLALLSRQLQENIRDIVTERDYQEYPLDGEDLRAAEIQALEVDASPAPDTKGKGRGRKGGKGMRKAQPKRPQRKVSRAPHSAPLPQHSVPLSPGVDGPPEDPSFWEGMVPGTEAPPGKPRFWFWIVPKIGSFAIRKTSAGMSMCSQEPSFTGCLAQYQSCLPPHLGTLNQFISREAAEAFTRCGRFAYVSVVEVTLALFGHRAQAPPRYASYLPDPWYWRWLASEYSAAVHDSMQLVTGTYHDAGVRMTSHIAGLLSDIFRAMLNGTACPNVEECRRLVLHAKRCASIAGLSAAPPKGHRGSIPSTFDEVKRESQRLPDDPVAQIPPDRESDTETEGEGEGEGERGSLRSRGRGLNDPSVTLEDLDVEMSASDSASALPYVTVNVGNDDLGLGNGVEGEDADDGNAWFDNCMDIAGQIYLLCEVFLKCIIVHEPLRGRVVTDYGVDGDERVMNRVNQSDSSAMKSNDRAHRMRRAWQRIPPFFSNINNVMNILHRVPSAPPTPVARHLSREVSYGVSSVSHSRAPSTSSGPGSVGLPPRATPVMDRDSAAQVSATLSSVSAVLSDDVDSGCTPEHKGERERERESEATSELEVFDIEGVESLDTLSLPMQDSEPCANTETEGETESERESESEGESDDVDTAPDCLPEVSEERV